MIRRTLALIGVVLAFIGTVIVQAMRLQKKQNVIDELEDYKDTRKDIDEAINKAPTDYDESRDYLVFRSRRSGNP